MNTEIQKEEIVDDTLTYLHKAKCTKCGVHFIVCSWEKDKESFFCPECGKLSPQIRWIETTADPIFQIVPGIKARLERIGDSLIPEEVGLKMLNIQGHLVAKYMEGACKE